MLRRIILLWFLMLHGLSALAQGSTFSSTVGSAVLCLDDVEPGFFANYMSAIKPSYKQEEGAYWYKSSEQLFGAPVTEVFVSDGSSAFRFVGIVSSLPPEQLAEAITAAAPAGVVFKKLDPKDKYSIFVSPLGAVIAFHQGKKSKIYCRRDRLLD